MGDLNTLLIFKMLYPLLYGDKTFSPTYSISAQKKEIFHVKKRGVRPFYKYDYKKQID
jgi:hypothetical protein